MCGIAGVVSIDGPLDPALSDAITVSYLVHAVPRRAFGSEG